MRHATNCSGRTNRLTGLVSDSAELDRGTDTLARLARDWNADILHLNLPSQAAGLPDGPPVVVASHSCVPTWWRAVHGIDLPAAWAWQTQRNQAGFRRADAVVVPSRSHGAALNAVYSELPPLHVIHNATAVEPADAAQGTTDPQRRTLVGPRQEWRGPGRGGRNRTVAGHPGRPLERTQRPARRLPQRPDTRRLATPGYPGPDAPIGDLCRAVALRTVRPGCGRGRDLRRRPGAGRHSDLPRALERRGRVRRPRRQRRLVPRLNQTGRRQRLCACGYRPQAQARAGRSPCPGRRRSSTHCIPASRADAVST